MPLYVAEFEDPMQSGVLPGVVRGAPVAEQTVAISGSSNSSNTFAGTTKIIRVHTDAVCSIAIGPSPTATTSKMRMAANQTEYFWVSGGSDKIAVISNT